jgi:hypothetical protein
LVLAALGCGDVRRQEFDRALLGLDGFLELRAAEQREAQCIQNRRVLLARYLRGPARCRQRGLGILQRRVRRGEQFPGVGVLGLRIVGRGLGPGTQGLELALPVLAVVGDLGEKKIGRASCRERVS